MQAPTINKIRGLINIANKAGYLIIGSDLLKDYRKKLFLILKSDNGGKNLNKIAEHLKNITNCQVKTLETADFVNIVKIDNCKIVGLKNKGLSEEILKYIRGEELV